MYISRKLPVLLALSLASSAYAQTTVALPSALQPLLPLPSIVIAPLPPIPPPWLTLPSVPPLPVIPVGPRLKGDIPIQYKQTTLTIHYDTQSPYPVSYTLTGIVGAP
ncbi:MAG: hypothetical protein EPN60_03535 [Nevskiaceae bacterium]|jgi:hypothetical protein|nr:MAG: hypothetical protein EPO48_13815 [Nevskiaceae bacterium]TAM32771.1 MAG: hypothetical protein EPN60_03535 [Nevskiaceae bacterium]